MEDETYFQKVQSAVAQFVWLNRDAGWFRRDQVAKAEEVLRAYHDGDLVRMKAANFNASEVIEDWHLEVIDG